MIQFPCPQCGAERSALTANCDQCGWLVLPARTEELPRQINRREQRVIGWVAFISAMIAAVRGGLLWGPYGALYLVPVIVAYCVTLTVLVLELVAAFTSARRPQFSLGGMFVFTTIWAAILLVVQWFSPAHLELLFRWPRALWNSVWEPLVLLPFFFLAITWCFTVPIGLAYNAIGVTRHRPAPIFAYVFLSSVLGFLTLLLLPLVTRRFWPPWYVMALVVIMMSAAVGFLLESYVLRMSSDPAHRRGAMVAMMIALQTYIASLDVFWRLSISG